MNLKYTVCQTDIQFLKEKYPNVYSNKEGHRTHTRKYVGVVLRIEKFYYYVPMSSPKESDYQIAGHDKVIKKSIVPIIRIVVKNNQGEKKLKGTLRISHMIPVLESELELYDLENEVDAEYKALIQSQIIFLRKNKEKIENNAKLLYNQKVKNDLSAGYVKTSLDFQALESSCIEYERIYGNNSN